MNEKDYLWLNLRELPYFRALLRAVEASFYQDLELPPPTLDVGCGDGHFASVTFERTLEVGLDPWAAPLRQASSHHSHRLLLQADGGRMPFPNNYFASAISNSVLEHILHVEQVLCETGRVLKPGAPFLFCVPNDRFLQALSLGVALDKLRLSLLGDAYRSFFNRISRHAHCNDSQTWAARLEAACFRIESYWHYFPPQSLRALEWGHYLGLPSLVCRWVTGRWILAPTRWNLAITRRVIEPSYQRGGRDERGVYTFYVARRV